jgi:hypothetical protein
MDVEQERDFYARPENQTAQGPARRRREDPTAAVVVRRSRDLLEEIRRRVGDDEQAVSAWIAQAAENRLRGIAP